MNTLARVAVAAVLASAGCATGGWRSEHALIGKARDPYPGAVRISMDGAPPPGEAEEVGIVTATGWGRSASLEVVLAALQAEAARLGCNAVVRVRYDRGSENATATGVAVVLR